MQCRGRQEVMLETSARDGIQMALGDTNVGPDFCSFDAAMRVWLKRGNIEAAKALFIKMCAAHEKRENMKPSLVAFRNILDAAIRSRCTC